MWFRITPEVYLSLLVKSSRIISGCNVNEWLRLTDPNQEPEEGNRKRPHYHPMTSQVMRNMPSVGIPHYYVLMLWAYILSLHGPSHCGICLKCCAPAIGLSYHREGRIRHQRWRTDAKFIFSSVCRAVTNDNKGLNSHIPPLTLSYH